MKYVVILTCVIFLAGCAGNNPHLKLRQAESVLWQSGQPVRAEDLITEAMEVFRQRGDELGMADAYHSFGNLYKDDSYHTKWAEEFKRRGTFDPSYDKALKNFVEAKTLFEKHGDEVGVAKTMLGIGNVYGLKKDQEKECSYYKESGVRYNAAKEAGKIKIEAVINNPRYKNVGEVAEAFYKGYCLKDN